MFTPIPFLIVEKLTHKLLSLYVQTLLSPSYSFHLCFRDCLEELGATILS